MVDKTLEQKLLSIIEEIYDIRVSVKESQGQGFLFNAEHSIVGFMHFINALPKDIKLSIASKPTVAVSASISSSPPAAVPATISTSITATPITLTTSTPKLVMDKA